MIPLEWIVQKFGTTKTSMPCFAPGSTGCKDGGGACGKDCLCMPCCVAGICLPLYSCICCSCERSDNAWVTRDKHGVMTGAIFLIDHEEGTLACYSVKCCTTQLKDEPDCYWTAM